MRARQPALVVHGLSYPATSAKRFKHRRRALPRPVWGIIGEEEFARWVVGVAERNGWCGHHNRSSQGSVAGVHRLRHHGHDDAYGWPDWVFWHPLKGRFLVRELKTEIGPVRPEQKRTIADLVASGIDAKVWRPRHELEIEETFARD